MARKRLALVRHAKSSWADPDLADRDRPLNARGRRAARIVGEHLRDAGIRPDLVLCSSATRARQTLELLDLPKRTDIVIDDLLYGAAATELLARLRVLRSRIDSALLVAHNPGIEDLAGMLVSKSRALPDSFPTGAVADLRFAIRNWGELDTGTGELREFVIPRELKRATPEASAASPVYVAQTSRCWLESALRQPKT